MWKVFEGQILARRVEFSLWELLGISKREFHDLLVHLLKRNRQTKDEQGGLKVNANVVLRANVGVEDKLLDSHYTKPHWAHATTKILVRTIW